jgi:dolichol-phosphate mannosyltransferase
LALNRLANAFIRFMFRIKLNDDPAAFDEARAEDGIPVLIQYLPVTHDVAAIDTTNAFKAYRTSVIQGCRPLLSPHFNITVELPLKTIVRCFTWTVILPITWRNRTSGVSKFQIKEMGSRYVFICLYLWLEKYFSRGDYRKQK